MTIPIHPDDTCVYAVEGGVQYRVSLDDPYCSRSNAFVSADSVNIYLSPQDTALPRHTGTFAFHHTAVTLRTAP